MLFRSTESVAEITDAAVMLDGLLDPAPLFRPFGRGGRIGPHLLSSVAVERLCADRYTVALWSSVPRDWVDPAGWVDVALDQIRGNPWPVVVLHDFADACLERLPAFLDELDRLAVEYRTDLPADCTPIRDGDVLGDISAIVTNASNETATAGRP